MTARSLPKILSMVSMRVVIISRSCMNLVWDRLSNSVRRGRDPSMKYYGITWSDEQSSRFIRSNPSMYTLLSGRKNKRGPADAGTNDKCEEEDSTSIKGPLIYSDYGEQLL